MSTLLPLLVYTMHDIEGHQLQAKPRIVIDCHHLLESKFGEDVMLLICQNFQFEETLQESFHCITCTFM